MNYSNGELATQSKDLDHLVPQVYDELRRLARRYLNRELPCATLQPTVLVNEAYLRLSRQRDFAWQNKTHVLAVAAGMMRRILVDHARKHHAGKRNGVRVSLDLQQMARVSAREIDLLALDRALADLEAFDARQARIVELRFFAGLTIEETAAALDASPATVKREWTLAKAWLRRELQAKRDT